MSGFYVIKIINKRGERGYLIDSPDGYKIALEAVTGDVANFGTFEEAATFIRKNRLENNGCKAYVLSNEDLLNEKPTGIVNAEQLGKKKEELYFLETDKGMRLCYYARTQDYYFKKCDVGFVIYQESQLPALKKQVADWSKKLKLSITIRKMSELRK